MFEEAKYLKPFFKFEFDEPKLYSVSKDNILKYAGNRYSLPFGTYKNSETRVALKEENSFLIISSAEGVEIARHPIPETKGNFLRNANHLWDNKTKIETLIQDAVSTLHNPQMAAEYIEKIREINPRYIRDQVGRLKKAITTHGVEKNLKMSHLPRNCDLNKYDYTSCNGLAKTQINQLREMRWLEDKYNLIILGPPGTGKTYIASGLGFDATKIGYRVPYGRDAKPDKLEETL